MEKGQTCGPFLRTELKNHSHDFEDVCIERTITQKKNPEFGPFKHVLLCRQCSQILNLFLIYLYVNAYISIDL